jgi:hypothetical protein
VTERRRRAYWCVDTFLAGSRQGQGGTRIQEFDNEVVYVALLTGEGTIYLRRWKGSLGATERIQGGRDDETLHLW